MKTLPAGPQQRGPSTLTEEKPPTQILAPKTVAKRGPEADARLKGDKNRIEVKTDTVEWFTDRPQRKAGIAAARELVDPWKGYGFDEQPPNAP